MSSSALIQEYLNRCSKEPGEIEGLVPTHSSEDDDATSSDESGESYGNESDGSGEANEEQRL